MRMLISTDDVKKDVLYKHSKIKLPIVISFLITVIAVVFDIILLVFPQSVLTVNVGQLRRFIMIIVCTLFIVLMSVFLIKFFRCYYRIKNDKFIIVSEKLYHKNIEVIMFYKGATTENVFYFKSGRIFVDDSMYKNTAIGDEFYLVMLDDKAPYYIYDKKKYKIDM